ncbi:ATP-dependent RecD-like DNA helicase [Acutalibacter sp.]|uniref:SF1B family DNA helicase RecD2 n=1 Tax=Acutalibacter sp. TaxID=1918636 RepID=UPI00216BD3BD|nr:ATP-dependent RecD-like DNA helicase [Acutalibacter sp.]
MSDLLELNGSVEQVIYHNEKNQYTVLNMLADDDFVTVVGSFPFVSAGEELQVFGKWENNPAYGEQFRAEAFQRARPATAEAMLKYLASGAIKGVGRALAARMVEAFGVNALEVIEKDPERLAQIKGVTLAKAREISAEFQRIIGIRELMAFLGAFGVAPEEAILVWKKYGEESISCVQQDPYSLCDPEIGLSFGVADAVAQSMECPQDDAGRLQAGMLYVLRHNLDNGHTCLPWDSLCQVGARMLGVAQDLAQDAVGELLDSFRVMEEEIGGRRFIFLQQQHLCEEYIAGRMKAMLRSPPNALYGAEVQTGLIEQSQGIQYAAKQRAAIKAAMEQGVLILTGGPGTGKTTTLNAIIHILKQAGERVLLAAPTGRAAKRMSELTGEEAKTIHRMLQVEWDEQDRPVFNRNERNPLECECLVIDEMSMVDAYVFESVLRALPLGCRLILVGDSDQLPSVGAGNVLGDLIASALFPTVQLKEIFRQSMESLIVTSAHRIVEGQIPQLTVRDNDFFFLPSREPAAAQELVVGLCAQRLPKSYGFSCVEDIQVLCPSRKGEMGTVELNKLLREAINPAEKGKPEAKINGQLFREGDKVMQVRNDYHLPWTKDDGAEGQGVFNGDMGVVTEIDKPGGAVRVRIDDKTVLYDFEHAANELEPAYAVTVHKSQGNEFTAVVIPVLKVPGQLRYRNLLYTAVTRAKKLLILVGERSVLGQMIENNRKTRRYTGLKWFLERESPAELPSL